MPKSEAHKQSIKLKASEGNFWQRNPWGVCRKFVFTFFDDIGNFASGNDSKRYAAAEVRA
jgi:hypothetical protein